MSQILGQYHYKLIKDSMKNQLMLLEEYKEVNDFLTKNKWLFISPIFFQGYDLSYFLKLSKKEGDQKENINNLIFNKFYNLDLTASFIDGYCKRCKYIEPFAKSIEHSLVLTFQKDYEGAIKTLIPIIEGVLRKYLYVEQSIESNNVKFKHLKKSLIDLKEDLVLKYSFGLLNYFDQNKTKVTFTKEQIDDLVLLEKEYNEIWFSFLINFINNSLYLDTNREDMKDRLNRHTILHELGINVYNLENYIKVYFVIQFLTWVFLRKEGQSILNQIEGFRFFEKAIAYENIIKLSEKLIYEKHLLYKNHKHYDQDLLRQKQKVTFDKKGLTSWILKYKILKAFNRFFWIRRIQ